MAPNTPNNRLQRKCNGAVTVIVRLTFDTMRDADLIAELEYTPQGELAGKIREMMRSGSFTGKFAVDALPVSTREIDIGIEI